MPSDAVIKALQDSEEVAPQAGAPTAAKPVTPPPATFSPAVMKALAASQGGTAPAQEFPAQPSQTLSGLYGLQEVGRGAAMIPGMPGSLLGALPFQGAQRAAAVLPSTQSMSDRYDRALGALGGPVKPQGPGDVTAAPFERAALPGALLGGAGGFTAAEAATAASEGAKWLGFGPLVQTVLGLAGGVLTGGKQALVKAAEDHAAATAKYNSAMDSYATASAVHDAAAKGVIVSEGTKPMVRSVLRQNTWDAQDKAQDALRANVDAAAGVRDAAIAPLQARLDKVKGLPQYNGLAAQIQPIIDDLHSKFDDEVKLAEVSHARNMLLIARGARSAQDAADAQHAALVARAKVAAVDAMAAKRTLGMTTKPGEPPFTTFRNALISGEIGGGVGALSGVPGGGWIGRGIGAASALLPAAVRGVVHSPGMVGRGAAAGLIPPLVSGGEGAPEQ